MRILLIAMADSIHTVRWLNQIADLGWDLHLFPSTDSAIVHPELKNITVYQFGFLRYKTAKHTENTRSQLGWLTEYARLHNKALRKIQPDYRARQLVRVIRNLRPDVVHSLEIQSAGYLTLEAKKLMKSGFPPWIVTNWGSDIYLFGRLVAHRPRIHEVLASCEYYSCECRRDVNLAKKHGFKGKILPVFPNTGGVDLTSIKKLRACGKTSDRRIVMLKGYQNWSGRALTGLRALERCKDLLQGYTVVIYSPSKDVSLAAELFEQSTAIPVRIIPPKSPHADILRLHGMARISIGLGISDAISTSLLEAIVMGSFPLQSWTACADEWIVDGLNGILVPPDDPDVVELALRRALTDDTMVDRAVEKNYRLAADRLDMKRLRSAAVELYKTVGKGTPCHG